MSVTGLSGSVFIQVGQMALQLRSQSVSFCPNHWVTAGSGHVQAGESYTEAGARELFEEIGIQPSFNLQGYRIIYPAGWDAKVPRHLRRGI